jgi:hypothetical protein
MAARVEPGSLAVARRPYLALALLVVAIAVAGFWPSYYRPVLAGTFDGRPLVHLHAIVFTGWLALLIAQAAFAAAGRIDLHRALGRAGIGYGVALVVLGLVIAFSFFERQLASGEAHVARAFLFSTLSDMVIFGGLFAAAIANRSRPARHKRLMLVATTYLLIAPVGRIAVLATMPLHLAVWLSPIVLAALYDYLSQRIVHPIYVTSLIGLAAVEATRADIGETAVWQAIAGWIETLVV